MKKILFLLTLSLAFFIADAQTFFSGTTSKPSVSTLVSGAPVYSMEVPVLNATVDTLNLTTAATYNARIRVSVRVLKSASGGGTIAGTVRLYGSNYGTTGTWTAVGDTLTLANQTVNYKTWEFDEPTYRYYRLLQDGGTTMAGTISANAYGIKPN